MYLVFDIGVTNMRLAVSQDKESFISDKIVPTPVDFNKGIQTFKEVADQLLAGQNAEKIAGGIASPIDKNKTMIIHQGAGMNEWVNKPLRPELEKLFGCRVILENDTTVGGIGEAVKGSGKGYKSVAYIALGSGVGGKRIISGKIDENSFNFEPGHQIIVPDGHPCNCGGKGHMETYVSGSYFEEVYGQKGENITDPQIWDKIAKYLAVSLVNTTVHWDPDVIVLGGSVAKSIPLDKVNTYFKELLTIYPNTPKILLGTLGHDAGFYGALELLKSN